MSSNLPLRGKTVVLTGTQKITSTLEDIHYYGGHALYCPLIETREIIGTNDAMELEVARNYDWLIFTSQNAVDMFYTKMKRMQMEAWRFRGKIAAVGVKTAEALDRIGFKVHFTPSIYSADYFVEEFPTVAGQGVKCLFVRGDLAKSTLKSRLPFAIQEWTVYETVEKTENVTLLLQTIQQQDDVTVIFASPSAVNVYAQHIAPIVGWDSIHIAAIGHVTSDAIEAYGATVHIQPEKYTMQAVLAEIIQMEGR